LGMECSRKLKIMVGSVITGMRKKYIILDIIVSRVRLENVHARDRLDPFYC